MDGTTFDCIIIPIVVMVSLAAWLTLVMLADRPAKAKPQPSAATGVLADIVVLADAAHPATVPRQAAAPAEERAKALAR